ncbi:dihydrofolate reductase [Paenibacillus sp. 1781tsa1]|uniref:dihydrofolate reductase n=1 Tax=Paenibacillus sp. 1781tsa1 TaxID=2953810 RepID=UPI00209D2644|nr:dihydrofolate reductase [Paenibacillus sp. 1781tsa1]MCP1184923.1 dihydrofolate reductase [Paenibacillus sp. 1781tsa1]
MSKLSIIVATDKNGLIGNDGRLPWHIPWDLKYFKEMTVGKNLIMGRKTYESIGKILPNRTNIILTTKENYQAEGCIVVNNMDEVIKIANESIVDSFVIGGSSIYEQFIARVEDMYINEIQSVFEGDAYFPTYDENEWDVTEEQLIETNEGEKCYKIIVKYIRINKNKYMYKQYNM